MRQTPSRPKFGCHQHQRGLKQKLKLSKLKFTSRIPTFQIPNLTLEARRKAFAYFGNAAITRPRTNLSFCLVAISLESTTPAVISSQILTLHFFMPSVPVDNRLWPAGSNLITSSLRSTGLENAEPVQHKQVSTNSRGKRYNPHSQKISTLDLIGPSLESD